LLSGFGVLWCLWRFGNWPSDRPGLFDYRSAVWGDGVLLPVMAFALVYAARRLPTAPAERRWCIAAGGTGILVSSVAQLLWLLDPSPRLNWTLPSPHRLNFAGIYHACFLILATGFFVALWVLTLRRVRVAPSASHPLEPRWAFAAIGVAALCVAGFFSLLLIDNQAARGTRSSDVTEVLAAGSGVVLLLLLFWSVKGRH
jgi:hypothetical protein